MMQFHLTSYDVRRIGQSTPSRASAWHLRGTWGFYCSHRGGERKEEASNCAETRKGRRSKDEQKPGLSEEKTDGDGTSNRIRSVISSPDTVPFKLQMKVNFH